MPRAKWKQAALEKRDKSYQVLDVCVCLNCRFYWNRWSTCRPDHLQHRADDISQHRQGEPLGTCELWEGKAS